MGTTPAGEIFTAFRKVIAAVILFNDRVAQQTGMSMSESQFIHLLELHGSMTPSDLATRSGLTSGSVTGVIDRLEALNFVRRERHATDRRKVVVVLDAARVAQHLAPLYVERGAALARAVDELSARDQKVVLRFLQSLTSDPE